MHSRRFHIENVDITTYANRKRGRLYKPNLGPIVTLIVFVWAARVVAPLSIHSQISYSEYISIYYIIITMLGGSIFNSYG